MATRKRAEAPADDEAILIVVHNEDADSGGTILVLKSACIHPLVRAAWERASAPTFATRIDSSDAARFRDCELLIAGGSSEAKIRWWPKTPEGGTEEMARLEFIERGEEHLIIEYPKTNDAGLVWDDSLRLLKVIALWTWM